MSKKNIVLPIFAACYRNKPDVCKIQNNGIIPIIASIKSLPICYESLSCKTLILIRNKLPLRMTFVLILWRMSECRITRASTAFSVFAKLTYDGIIIMLINEKMIINPSILRKDLNYTKIV